MKNNTILNFKEGLNTSISLIPKIKGLIIVFTFLTMVFLVSCQKNIVKTRSSSKTDLYYLKKLAKIDSSSFTLNYFLLDTLDFKIRIYGNRGIHGCQICFLFEKGEERLFMTSYYRNKRTESFLSKYFDNLHKFIDSSKINTIKSEINYYYICDYKRKKSSLNF